jgi:hypothetical protein
MLTISDPKDIVYYIEDLTVPAQGAIDPLRPFSSWDSAMDYAMDEMGLDIDQFKIISWEVD